MSGFYIYILIIVTTKLSTYFIEYQTIVCFCHVLRWDDLNNKCGKFQKMDEITVGKIQTYDVTYTLCHFENMKLKMKLVFDKENKIAGLFFVPENQQ